ncbi:hypothetical protein EV142_102461 [Flavobacterium circumlabens]|uniref:Uncharacterized protein n=1 Tax=Flavobacterium circumlabens TaxID=2133765 RepID=A0ABY2B2M9_9FLAO|nr:hypothetical protein EV142_102461 [Flavobacterium circumlabens]
MINNSNLNLFKTSILRKTIIALFKIQNIKKAPEGA